MVAVKRCKYICVGSLTDCVVPGCRSMSTVVRGHELLRGGSKVLMHLDSSEDEDDRNIVSC